MANGTLPHAPGQRLFGPQLSRRLIFSITALAVVLSGCSSTLTSSGPSPASRDGRPAAPTSAAGGQAANRLLDAKPPSPPSATSAPPINVHSTRPKGCAPASAVTFAVTASSTEPAPALSDKVIHLLNAAGQRSDACVDLLVGGDVAQVVATLPLTPFRSNGQPEHGSTRVNRLRENIEELRATLTQLGATSSGLDALGLLRAAVRRRGSPGTLVLETSGLSTVRPLAWQDIGWDGDTDQLVIRLADQGWLPSLAGWDVLFVGLGDVAGSQPRLTPPLQARVIALWTAICHAARAASCTVDTQLVAASTPRARNEVPVVPLPRVVTEQGYVLLPSSLLFGIDSAEVDPTSDGALRGVVAGIGARTVRVIGHTDASTGTANHNAALSRARALKVAERLVALGLAAQQIVGVEGVGSSGNSLAQEQANPGLVTAHRAVELQFVPPTSGPP